MQASTALIAGAVNNSTLTQDVSCRSHDLLPRSLPLSFSRHLLMQLAFCAAFNAQQSAAM